MSRPTAIRNASAALAEGLRTGREISLDAVDVLRSFTSLLVPLSVAALPNGQRLVPSLDAAVDRGYNILVQAVELRYERAAATLERFSGPAV